MMPVMIGDLIQATLDNGQTWKFYGYVVSPGDIAWFDHRLGCKQLTKRFPYRFRAIRDGVVVEEQVCQ